MTVNKYINKKGTIHCSGFSLVELMIAASIMSGLAYGLTAFLGNFNSKSRVTEQRMEVISIRDEIKGILRDRPSCTETFLGIKPLVPQSTAEGTPPQNRISGIKKAVSTPQAGGSQINYTYRDAFKLSTSKLGNPTYGGSKIKIIDYQIKALTLTLDPTDGTITASPNDTSIEGELIGIFDDRVKGTAELTITFKRSDKRVVKQKIVLEVEIDGDDESIISCKAGSMDEQDPYSPLIGKVAYCCLGLPKRTNIAPDPSQTYPANAVSGSGTGNVTKFSDLFKPSVDGHDCNLHPDSAGPTTKPPGWHVAYNRVAIAAIDANRNKYIAIDSSSEAGKWSSLAELANNGFQLLKNMDININGTLLIDTDPSSGFKNSKMPVPIVKISPTGMSYQIIHLSGDYSIQSCFGRWVDQ